MGRVSGCAVTAIEPPLVGLKGFYDKGSPIANKKAPKDFNDL
jgi:hypothetical protein